MEKKYKQKIGYYLSEKEFATFSEIVRGVGGRKSDLYGIIDEMFLGGEISRIIPGDGDNWNDSAIRYALTRLGLEKYKENKKKETRNLLRK